VKQSTWMGGTPTYSSWFCSGTTSRWLNRSACEAGIRRRLREYISTMPYCPRCRYEYREGFTKCPDCDAALVDVLLPQENETTSEFPEEAVSCWASDDLIRVDAVCAAVESQGIPCRVSSSMHHRAFAAFAFGDSLPPMHNLMVPASKCDDARRIIKEFLRDFEAGTG
jgi:hypothetical protein